MFELKELIKSQQAEIRRLKKKIKETKEEIYKLKVQRLISWTGE